MAHHAPELIAAPQAVAAASALVGLSVVIVALRFFTRFRQGGRYGADDWLTIPALLLLIGMGISMIISEKYGVARYPHHHDEEQQGRTGRASLAHLYEDSTPADDDENGLDWQSLQPYHIAAKGLWSFQLLTYPMTALVKLSILYFYRRVFWPDVYRLLGRATLITGALVIVWSLAFLLLNIFSCGGDVTLNWSIPPVYSKHCFANLRLEQPYALSDLLFNVVLLLLPLNAIHQLNLGLRRRVAIGCILLLGSSAIAASTVRAVLLIELIDTSPSYGEEHHTLHRKTHHLLHVWGTIMLWAIIEAGLSLQTACLPVLCQLLPTKVFGHSSTGRMGSVLTQRDNGPRRGGRGRRRRRMETGAAAGGGPTGIGRPGRTDLGYGDDPSTVAGYPRSSGWFARYRQPAAGSDEPSSMSAVDAMGVTFRRIHDNEDAQDRMSEISELDLEASGELRREQAAERENGGSGRERRADEEENSRGRTRIRRRGDEEMANVT